MLNKSLLANQRCGKDVPTFRRNLRQPVSTTFNSEAAGFFGTLVSVTGLTDVKPTKALIMDNRSYHSFRYIETRIFSFAFMFVL
jgi:hypothetical protein